MDIVVCLALIVLAAVFIFSSFIMFLMCQRRAQFFKEQVSIPLKFSKLRNENSDTVVQLSPLVAQILENNQWIYDVSGLLQHCVAILKLSHSVIEKLAKISLNSINEQLNESILIATHRIMPRFDDLIKTLATKQVDVRLLEARASSLVSASWALALPFTIICPKAVDFLNESLNEMEKHMEALRFVVDHAENYFNDNVDSNSKNSPLHTIIEESFITNHSDRDTDKKSAIAEEAPSDPQVDNTQ
ncbi:unnamed protein product [Dracunculus medinensis]|uniref:Transmembrane protein 98 n=1 Tax=Dracunculus medinensis TaxID=318479 RepID=A0A0N4UM95_DRAME|nr:unnamed protein product [Dracunculus medinensis]